MTDPPCDTSSELPERGLGRDGVAGGIAFTPGCP
jgi:hypothetical protein